MKAIEIRITRDEKGELEVWYEFRTTGPLCFGEMIEQVVKLILQSGPLANPGGYAMKLPQEWEEAGDSVKNRAAITLDETDILAPGEFQTIMNPQAAEGLLWSIEELAEMYRQGRIIPRNLHLELDMRIRSRARILIRKN